MFLAAQAQTKISLIGPGQFDENDTLSHLMLTQLCLSLSNQNKSLLAQLIQHVQAQAVKVHVQSQQRTKDHPLLPHHPIVVLQVPNTPHQLRNAVWDGKFSIMENLPHPAIEKYGSYAGCSTMSCIADLYYHGFQLDNLQQHPPDDNVCHIAESARAQAILQNAREIHNNQDLENMDILYAFIWSDSFDSSYSSKCYRVSIHMTLITISPSPNAKDHLAYT
jgi:hypothetical protein